MTRSGLGTGIGVFCMAVAAIVIGAISFNDFDITKIAEVQSNTSCAGAPNIPYYLVIMGILLLSLLILKLFFQVKKTRVAKETFPETPEGMSLVLQL